MTLFEYDCPLCDWKHSGLGIYYGPDSEPNQYGKERLIDHFKTKHSQELVNDYLIDKFLDDAVKVAINTIKDKYLEEESKLYNIRKNKSLIQRILSRNKNK